MALNTKRVYIGGVAVGGGASVKIQSMCTTRTSDVNATCSQIYKLEKAGCEIVRVSVLDESDADSVREIIKKIHIPLVADIHFSAELAVRAIESGCRKVRINPGNIGGERQIKLVADCIKRNKTAVRVGSNTGSIEKDFLEKYGKNEYSLVESALKSVAALEKYGVENIVVSVKASEAPLTVKAYRLLSSRTQYPLHIGVTEAGVEQAAIVKSSAALGSLLMDGIGDTLRISITDDPVKEVAAAHRLLRAVGLDENYVDVVSCPTCGRCKWNSMELAKKVAAHVENCAKKLKIAVMGCVVNGPGEAKDCDLGIAGGDGYCLIFKSGEPYRKVSADCAEREFFKEIDLLLDER